MMASRRYAERRLNPFLGVLQVLESEVGRALSTDGHNWEIQLYAPRSVGWGHLGAAQSLELYRHGVWSEAEGLACFPRPPTQKREEANQASLTLIAAIRDALESLPFPLRDRYERWLLDASDSLRPLALLEAMTGAEPLAQGRAPRWRCTAGELPGQEAEGRAALEAQVAARAGQAYRSQWFRRETDGSGIPLAAGSVMPGQVQDALGGACLEAEVFPELLLWEGWEETGERERMGHYLARLAPRLLMLPLRPATRARLEQMAADQASVVDRFHRLYPQVMDPAWLVRLRVEARLRRGQEGPD